MNFILLGLFFCFGKMIIQFLQNFMIVGHLYQSM